MGSRKMKLQIMNYGALDLPGEGVELGGNREVEHCKKLRDLSYNVAALDYLLTDLPWHRPLKDFFSGVGMWALVASSRLNPSSMTLNEFDPACVAWLLKRFEWADVQLRDSYYNLDEQVAGVNLFDFTKCTWLTLKKEGWGRRLLEGSGCWLVISDCAGAKVHLNYRSYGLSRPSYDEYLSRYSSWIEAETPFAVEKLVACGGEVRPRSGYLLLHRDGKKGQAVPVHRITTEHAVHEVTRP